MNAALWLLTLFYQRFSDIFRGIKRERWEETLGKAGQAFVIERFVKKVYVFQPDFNIHD